jgi:hypothetical protein
VGVVVDRVERVGGSEALDQAGRPLGPDVLDAYEVGEDRLGVAVGRRERARLRDLDLAAVSGVVHPRSDHVRALPLLEVNKGADERDRLVLRAGGLDYGPAGLGVREANVADGHL